MVSDAKRGLAMRYGSRDRGAFIRRVVEGDAPPWRLTRSRDLAKLLGVSLQSLANWRVRETGPTPALRPRRGGNKTYYRLDDAAAWASNGRFASWEINRDWFASRGLVVDPSTEASTEFLIASADSFIPKV